jgi:hypothetical protein
MPIKARPVNRVIRVAREGNLTVGMLLSSLPGSKYPYIFRGSKVITEPDGERVRVKAQGGIKTIEEGEELLLGCFPDAIIMEA